jgi:hypothetical protein
MRVLKLVKHLASVDADCNSFCMLVCKHKPTRKAQLTIRWLAVLRCSFAYAVVCSCVHVLVTLRKIRLNAFAISKPYADRSESPGL